MINFFFLILSFLAPFLSDSTLLRDDDDIKIVISTTCDDL